MLTLEFQASKVEIDGDYVRFKLNYNEPLEDYDSSRFLFVYFIDEVSKKEYFECEYIFYYENENEVPYVRLDKAEFNSKIMTRDTVYVEMGVDLHNKFKYYHHFEVNFKSGLKSNK
jgi:hypothetical protein